ncbi:hypothetical protein [ANMV-1 virus]|nr:hypothetical protein [ANMV-1 virus]
MLNEVRARHIKKLVVEQIAPDSSIGGIIGFEITRREHTINGLEAQKEREQDEIIYLRSLDAKELNREAKENRDG